MLVKLMQPYHPCSRFELDHHKIQSQEVTLPPATCLFSRLTDLNIETSLLN